MERITQQRAVELEEYWRMHDASLASFEDVAAMHDRWHSGNDAWSFNVAREINKKALEA